MKSPISILPSPAGRLRLWACLWGGGAAWTAHLLAVWLIAEFGCLTGLAKPGPLDISWVAWLILAVTVVCLALAGIATYASWRHARRDTGKPARFLGRTGLVANPLFMLVIIVQTLPVFFYLRDCGVYIT